MSAGTGGPWDPRTRPAGRRGPWARLLRWVPFLVTVLEILVFVAVGRWIGFGWALLILLGSGVAGMAALRMVGFSTWRRLREQAAAQQLGAAQAGEALAGVGVRIFGAILLIVPGFVTSAVGVVLLVPPIGRLVSRLLPGPVVAGSLWRARPRPSGGDVVEGEVVEVDVEDVPPPQRSAADDEDAIGLQEGRDD